jgi:integrase
VKIRGALRDGLAAVGVRREIDDDGYVFPTRTRQRLGPDNFRNRALTAAVKRADENLEAAGLAPLKEGLTPHSMRRTFCSVLYTLGEDPGVVMDEMGHTDPELVLRVYRKVMRRGEDEKAQLRALVEGADWTSVEEGVEAHVEA